MDNFETTKYLKDFERATSKRSWSLDRNLSTGIRRGQREEGLSNGSENVR